MVILAGLHVVSHDVSDESLYSGGRVIHKISVKLGTYQNCLQRASKNELHNSPQTDHETSYIRFKPLMVCHLECNRLLMSRA